MPGTYRRIYLDFNASTPVAPEVIDAMRIVLEEPYGNSSSGHWAGRPASEAVDRSRLQVAGLLGCEPNETVFTRVPNRADFFQECIVSPLPGDGPLSRPRQVRPRS